MQSGQQTWCKVGSASVFDQNLGVVQRFRDREVSDSDISPWILHQARFVVRLDPHGNLRPPRLEPMQQGDQPSGC